MGEDLALGRAWRTHLVHNWCYHDDWLPVATCDVRLAKCELDGVCRTYHSKSDGLLQTSHFCWNYDLNVKENRHAFKKPT